jgi:uncharacterized protein YjiS (DUF1127 family)
MLHRTMRGASFAHSQIKQTGASEGTLTMKLFESARRHDRFEATTGDFANLLQTGLARFAAWRAARRQQSRLLRELSESTDRQLWDMGLSRADIPAVVRGAYRR